MTKRILLVNASPHSAMEIMLHTAAIDGDMVLLNSIDLNGKAPKEIQLIPFGVHDTMKYGKIIVDDESLGSIMSFRTKRMPNDEVIDYEHATFADPPIKAPASGWIKRLINKGKDGIWGVVEWTQEAKRMIEAKEYRYFSPVTLTRKSDHKVLGLLGGGLTNLPNIIGIVPLTNKSAILNPQSAISKEGPKMKKLLAVLGLSETATEDEAVIAVNKIKADGMSIVANRAVLAVLGVQDEATLSEVTGTIMAMKQSHTQVSELTKTVGDLRGKISERDANDAIALAINTGKITPAQKEWAVEYAKKDLAGFQVYVNKAPVVVPLDKIVTDDKSAGAGSGAQLDEVTLQVCKAFGNKPEDVKKHMVAA